MYKIHPESHDKNWYTVLYPISISLYPYYKIHNLAFKIFCFLESLDIDHMFLQTGSSTPLHSVQFIGELTSQRTPFVSVFQFGSAVAGPQGIRNLKGRHTVIFSVRIPGRWVTDLQFFGFRVVSPKSAPQVDLPLDSCDC